MLILGAKAAADCRRGADHVEEVVRDQTDAQHLRVAFTGERCRRCPDRGKTVEERRALTEVSELRTGKRPARVSRARHVGPDEDQPPRMRERQRLEKHRVHHAENRGGRSDTERERDDGGGGEAGRLSEPAARVADVAGKAVEPGGYQHVLAVREG
jgi:hypothetical protein